MSEYAYIRVSSTDQNEDRQLVAMNELKIPSKQIFIDKQSGKIELHGLKVNATLIRLLKKTYWK